MNRKLLMISTDRMIFDKRSAVASRMIEYSKNWNEVHIIILKLKSEILSLKPQISNHELQIADHRLSDNCLVYSTNSISKWLYAIDAEKIGQEIIRKSGITEITCQDPFITAKVGVALKNKFDLPIEIQLHTDIGSPNYTYKFSNRIRKIMAKKYLPRADRVRVVSNRIKSYLVNDLHIDSNKIEVRPITVDIEKIRNAPIIQGANLHEKYSQFEKIVLMASRIEPEKNIPLAIDAWKGVIKILPNAGLVIVGDGGEKSNLKSQIRKLGLDGSITMENGVDQATLFSYYKTSDAFLSTSLFEGYGMTFVEAQAAGCKVISTDVGVAREVGARIVEYESLNIAQVVIQSINDSSESRI